MNNLFTWTNYRTLPPTLRGEGNYYILTHAAKCNCRRYMCIWTKMWHKKWQGKIMKMAKVKPSKLKLWTFFWGQGEHEWLLCKVVYYFVLTTLLVLKLALISSISVKVKKKNRCNHINYYMLGLGDVCFVIII